MVCCLVIEEIQNADRMIKASGDLPLPDKTLIVCISGISVNNEEAQDAIQSRSLQPCLSLTVEVMVLFCEDKP